MNKQNFQQKSFVLVMILALAASTINLYGQQISNQKVKIALIYTVTTPELKEDTEREVKKQLGNNVEIMNYEVPSVFEEIRKTGYVTAMPAAKMIRTYMEAVEAGADAILSICSTVGDIAYSVQDVAKYLGVPIIMINDEMCREAVRKGNKIAIMATFPTAIAPTRNTILRVSREMGKRVEVYEVLVEGAFGLDHEQFKARMATEAEKIADKVDAIVFAQGSMAYCEEYIANRFQKIVLSNPRFAAMALKTSLIDKGLIINSVL